MSALSHKRITIMSMTLAMFLTAIAGASGVSFIGAVNIGFDLERMCTFLPNVPACRQRTPAVTPPTFTVSPVLAPTPAPASIPTPVRATAPTQATTPVPPTTPAPVPVQMPSFVISAPRPVPATPTPPTPPAPEAPTWNPPSPPATPTPATVTTPTNAGLNTTAPAAPRPPAVHLSAPPESFTDSFYLPRVTPPPPPIAPCTEEPTSPVPPPPLLPPNRPVCGPPPPCVSAQVLLSMRSVPGQTCRIIQPVPDANQCITTCATVRCEPTPPQCPSITCTMGVPAGCRQGPPTMVNGCQVDCGQTICPPQSPTNGPCTREECGQYPGTVPSLCRDGTVAGPTGNCIRNEQGSCVWETRVCPVFTGCDPGFQCIGGNPAVPGIVWECGNVPNSGATYETITRGACGVNNAGICKQCLRHEAPPPPPQPYCGDHICQNTPIYTETSQQIPGHMGSPYYCPGDCDSSTPPIQPPADVACANGASCLPSGTSRPDGTQCPAASMPFCPANTASNRTGATCTTNGGCPGNCYQICQAPSSPTTDPCAAANACGSPLPGVRCPNGSISTSTCQRQPSGQCGWFNVCNPTSPLGFCGDGTCNNGETITTCPADCTPSLPINNGTCTCGPQLGMPNRLCPDGNNVAGPTGNCVRHADGTCGWQVAECPVQPVTPPSETGFCGGAFPKCSRIPADNYIFGLQLCPPGSQAAFDNPVGNCSLGSEGGRCFKCVAASQTGPCPLGQHAVSNCSPSETRIMSCNDIRCESDTACVNGYQARSVCKTKPECLAIGGLNSGDSCSDRTSPLFGVDSTTDCRLPCGSGTQPTTPTEHVCPPGQYWVTPCPAGTVCFQAGGCRPLPTNRAIY